jgi:hypothetical protein
MKTTFRADRQCLAEGYSVKSPSQDKAKIGRSENESAHNVSNEVEKTSFEKNVTEQASVEIHSISPVKIPGYFKDICARMLVSLKAKRWK